MATDESGRPRRHSVAVEPTLIHGEQERAQAEARNGLAQFDLSRQIIEEAISRGAAFKMRPSIIQNLHRSALEGISTFAGNWRPAGVSIEGSRHNPVDAFLVPERVEDLCEYLNENWSERSAIHLSAYSMWRLNWIHPFSDGNGRTSRALSYVVLCVKLGSLIPGAKTIPDFIVENRNPYFDALEDADKNCTEGRIDVSKMEVLLEGLLAKQLLEFINHASGK